MRAHVDVCSMHTVKLARTHASSDLMRTYSQNKSCCKHTNACICSATRSCAFPRETCICDLTELPPHSCTSVLTCSTTRRCVSARPACICDLTELPPHSYTSVLTCPAARSCALPARSTCICDLTELPLLLTHNLQHRLRVPWRRRKKHKNGTSLRV